MSPDGALLVGLGADTRAADNVISPDICSTGYHATEPAGVLPASIGATPQDDSQVDPVGPSNGVRPPGAREPGRACGIRRLRLCGVHRRYVLRDAEVPFTSTELRKLGRGHALPTYRLATVVIAVAVSLLTDTGQS